jgi:hypothetical protein
MQNWAPLHGESKSWIFYIRKGNSQLILNKLTLWIVKENTISIWTEKQVPANLMSKKRNDSRISIQPRFVSASDGCGVQ